MISATDVMGSWISIYIVGKNPGSLGFKTLNHLFWNTLSLENKIMRPALASYSEHITQFARGQSHETAVLLLGIIIAVVM